MALFVFSATHNVLRRQIEQGVEIRLVADPGCEPPFSEVPISWGHPSGSCKVERAISLWIRFNRNRHPRLARGDKLHHKFAVIDNKTVILVRSIGPSAAHTNDETLQHHQLAAHHS